MFYDAECVVSAIAKFLVHLFGEGRGVIKWERRGRGKEWGGKEDGIEGREMGMHEIISPKRNICGICGCPLGATAKFRTFLGKLFSGTTFLSQIVCLGGIYKLFSGLSLMLLIFDTVIGIPLPNDYYTRSSAVAKRPHDAPSGWKLLGHSRSLKVDYGVCNIPVSISL